MYSVPFCIVVCCKKRREEQSRIHIWSSEQQTLLCSITTSIKILSLAQAQIQTHTRTYTYTCTHSQHTQHSKESNEKKKRKEFQSMYLHIYIQNISINNYSDDDWNYKDKCAITNLNRKRFNHHRKFYSFELNQSAWTLFAKKKKNIYRSISWQVKYFFLPYRCCCCCFCSR